MTSVRTLRPAIVLTSFLTIVPLDGQPRPLHTDSEVNHAAAFGDPLDGLSALQREEYEAGFQLFIKTWSRAEGLGPHVNARNCITCHSEPMPGGSGTAQRTFVIQLPTSNVGLGTTSVFQRFVVNHDDLLVSRSPPASSSLRKPPALFGLGLLEVVPVEDLLLSIEQNMRRGDRVRGRIVSSGSSYGRFGWKGNFSTIGDVVNFALYAEMGLRTLRYPTRPNEARHEFGIDVDTNKVRLISQFIRFLAPPPSRRVGDTGALGEELFEDMGCALCHRTTLATSTTADEPFRSRVIHPYTDLLLHDMGGNLVARDLRDLDRWYRTPPLWGLASTGPPYLHDGRASNVQEAILLHSGEASASVAAFNALSHQQQRMVLEFLASL
jgi:CxxC motif-containing protein (DUF1111 family)